MNLNAEAKASVDVEVDLNVDLAYSVTSLKFVFPPSQGGSSVDLSPKDSRKCHLLSRDINSNISLALRLSVSPNVATNTTIEAHIIPSVCCFNKMIRVNVADGILCVVELRHIGSRRGRRIYFP